MDFWQRVSAKQQTADLSTLPIPQRGRAGSPRHGQQPSRPAQDKAELSVLLQPAAWPGISKSNITTKKVERKTRRVDQPNIFSNAA